MTLSDRGRAKFSLTTSKGFCSQANEPGMSQMVGPGPLQELDLRDQPWPQPDTPLHFLGGQRRRVVGFGQVLSPMAHKW